MIFIKQVIHKLIIDWRLRLLQFILRFHRLNRFTFPLLWIFHPIFLPQWLPFLFLLLFLFFNLRYMRIQRPSLSSQNHRSKTCFSQYFIHIDLVVFRTLIHWVCNFNQWTWVDHFFVLLLLWLFWNLIFLLDLLLRLVLKIGLMIELLDFVLYVCFWLLTILEYFFLNVLH